MSEQISNDSNRRLNEVITIGTVLEIDEIKALARVTAGERESNWLPVMMARAGGDRTYWMPDIDEQVVILAQSGDPAQGVILMSINQDDYPPPVEDAEKHHYLYKDGAVFEYDRKLHHLKVILPPEDGDEPAATMEIVAPGGITITGDITHEGDYTQTGDQTVTGTVTVSEDVIAGTNDVSLVNHVHGGVQTGTSETAAPT